MQASTDDEPNPATREAPNTESPKKDLQIRFFVACPRSGKFRPDYSILRDARNHDVVQRASGDGKRILICKEELGNDTKKGECSYELLPSRSEYAAVRPVFLIRDPVRVFDSWKKIGWTDLRSLIDCFDNLFRMLAQADSSLISCLLYEQLAQEPRREVERVCARWGIPFSPAMLDFTMPFGSSFIYKSPAEKDIYCHRQPPGLFSTVQNSSTIVRNVPCHGLVTNEEKGIIERGVGRLYLTYWRDHVLQLGDALAEKQWFGFDLDDTLHEFRRASSVATNRVLEAMHDKYGIPLAELKSQYSKVLRTSTSNAFVDSKPSSEYRSERFIAVARHFSSPLEHDQPFLDQLLHLYKTSLQQSLELKSGALELLQTVKRLGKKVVIITEGPQDAQEWTVENLGLSPYVDYLATTNHFKVSKTDGLFATVLATLGISPSEIAYVGDNELRDMRPAIAEGIFCFHLAEDMNCNLEVYPPRINTLDKLGHILATLQRK
ncbi:Haloacid dehalogenase-like hydrolase [Xylaria intraflava]|nr:Haloacid dehalogenase-like hydrolase [Xylaria intraflava]